MSKSGLQTPLYPQFTNIELTGPIGTGLFDQLMGTVKHHLLKEYEGQRITGTNFSTAYISSMQAVMQNTTQYLLGIMLIDEQKGQINAQTKLTEKELEKIDAELELLALEREKLRFQIDMVFPLEVQKAEAEIANLLKQGELIDAQIQKIFGEIAHMLAQEVLWVKQADKLDADILHLTYQNTLVSAQTDKVGAEEALINQKKITESANTSAGVAASGSLIGKQITLLSAQTLGFAGDLHVKAAKVYSDFASVWTSVTEPDEGNEILAAGAGGTYASQANSVAGTISGLG